MKTYPLKQPIIVTNDYGEKVATYSALDNIDIFISLSSHEVYGSADMRVQECSHIGLTKDKRIKKGMVIDDRFEVSFVNGITSQEMILVYMREFKNE